MIYAIKYLPEAIADISALKRTDIGSYEKILKLIKELHEHPRTGTSKPELLKYGKYSGLWSRRISKKHRLVYAINDREVIVLILSARGHYGDK